MIKNIALVITLFFLACITRTESKTLIYCAEAGPEHLNPSFTTSGATTEGIVNTIFDRLVQMKVGTTEIVPALAESWHISEDGLRYTFQLRKDVVFHANDYFTPTRYLNADDVLFSFERQWRKDHPYHKVGGGTYTKFISLGFHDLLKGINRIDDHTVEFVLNKPDASFLSDLNYIVINSQEYAETMLTENQPDTFDNHPIGTGPFVFLNYEKDTLIRYKAFDKYWQGRAKIDELIFTITPDSSVRFAKLQRGECHIMTYPNPSDLATARKLKDINIVEVPGLNIGYLAFNTTKPPFDNPKVRLALNLATNKKAILEMIFQGGAIPAKGPIPPNMWGYDETITDYPYDPKAARKLLKEAGIDPKTLNADLWAMPVARPYNPNARKMAELIQADWKKIGVEVNIVSIEWSEYLQRIKKGEHVLALIGMNYGYDPNTYMYLSLGCEAVKGGLNRARWCYQPYEALVTAAKQTTDNRERTKLYHQAQHIFHEQAPWVPISHSIIYQPMRKEVKNYKIDLSGYVNFYGVDIEP